MTIPPTVTRGPKLADSERLEMLSGLVASGADRGRNVSSQKPTNGNSTANTLMLVCETVCVRLSPEIGITWLLYSPLT